MLNKARKERDSRISICWDWDSFLVELKKGNMVLVPFCLETEVEEWVKEETKATLEAEAVEKLQGTSENEDREGFIGLTGAAKTLCIPFNQPPLPEGTKCFTGKGIAREWTLFGRSY